MVLVIGLTGGIASGKSLVASLFQELGACVIDTDEIAHALVISGSDAFNQIIEHFGQEYVTEDNELNRRKLRDRIFSHPEDKLWLENCLHPLIRGQVMDRLPLCGGSYCIVVIPLLVETWESHPYDFIDRVCVVDCDEHLRVARLSARDQLTPTQAENQIKQQASREDRLKMANDIIQNDLDEIHLQEQVVALDKTYKIMNQTD